VPYWIVIASISPLDKLSAMASSSSKNSVDSIFFYSFKTQAHIISPSSKYSKKEKI
jgi:hypothetical protein